MVRKCVSLAEVHRAHPTGSAAKRHAKCSVLGPRSQRGPSSLAKSALRMSEASLLAGGGKGTKELGVSKFAFKEAAKELPGVLCVGNSEGNRHPDVD